MALRINKGDGDDLGFAYEALLSGVLPFNQWRTWLYKVVDVEDEVPTFWWDLIDLPDRMETLSEWGRWRLNVYWTASDADQHALEGIGYKYHRSFKSDWTTRTTAMKALEQAPHIEQKFIQMFGTPEQYDIREVC